MKKMYFFMVWIALSISSFGQTVTTYNLPSAYKSSVFTVTVNGQNADVCQLPGTALHEHVVNFDFTGTVTVVVKSTIANNFSSGSIFPAHWNIIPTVSESYTKVTFTMDQPMQLTLVTSASERLYIFGNAPEVNPPQQGDPNVIYRGPGSYNENFDLTSGQTLYLHGGAVVKGTIDVWNAGQTSNVKILGRGYLICDNPSIPTSSDNGWKHQQDWHPLQTDNVSRLLVNGITLSAATRTWSVQLASTINSRFENMKIVSYYSPWNTDGIDFYFQCAKDTFVDCFYFGTDDAFAFFNRSASSGTVWDSNMVISNHSVRNTLTGGNFIRLHNVSDLGTEQIGLKNSTWQNCSYYGPNSLFYFSSGSPSNVSNNLIEGLYVGSGTGTVQTSSTMTSWSGSPDPLVPWMKLPFNGDNTVSTSPVLSWNTARGATSYQCQVSTASNFSTTVFDQSNISSTSVTVTGLTAGTTYYWRVRSKNSTTTSNWTIVPRRFTTASATDTQAPTVPSNLVSSAVTQTGFTLSWSASSDNVGVTGYDVYKDGVLFGSVSSLSVNVSGLTASTTYSMTVKAKDAAGNVSAASTPLQVTTSGTTDTQAPTIPSNLVSSAVTQTGFTLSWSASSDNVGVTGYDVYKNGVLFGSVTSLSVDVSGLTASTTYSMTVKAKDAAGNISASSTALQVTTSTAADPGANVTTYKLPAAYKSASFTVVVNGDTADVCHLSDYALHEHVVNFDFAGSVTVVVKTSIANYFSTGSLYPAHWGIVPVVSESNTKVTFTMDQPMQLTIAGNSTERLYIFGNAPEVNPPKNGDPNVIYRGPGSYSEDFDLTSGQTLYLHGGAVVTGSIDIWNAGKTTDVKIMGRGYLIYNNPGPMNDDHGWKHQQNWHPLQTDNVDRLLVNGVTISAATRTWTAQLASTTNSRFENMKIVSYFDPWNTDGFDFYFQCAKDTFVDCFYYGTDDAFAFFNRSASSGTVWDSNMVVSNHTVRNISAGGNFIRLHNISDLGTEQIGLKNSMWQNCSYWGPNQLFCFSSGTSTNCLNNLVECLYVGSGTANIVTSTNMVNFSASTDPLVPFMKYPVNGSIDQPASPILSWNAARGATSYRCQVSVKPDFSTTVFDQSNITSTSVTVNSLTAGTNYYWRVKSINATTSSNWTIVPRKFKITASGDTQAPSVPSGLVSSALAATSFTLSWSASTDNNSVTGYDVYKDGVLYGSSATTTLNITGLTAATTYSMSVKAKDAAGNVSAVSNVLSVTTASAADVQAPSTPMGLSSSAVTQVSFTLSWSASTDNTGVTSYDVFKNEVLYGNVASTSANIAGLTATTTYSMTVKAKDAAGNVSAASNALSVTTTSATDVQAPTTPTGLKSVEITETSFILNWSPSTDNTAVSIYYVYMNGNLFDSLSTNSLAVSGLVSGTKYTMTVKAKDAAGNLSALSSSLSVTTSESNLSVASLSDLISVYPVPSDGMVFIDYRGNDHPSVCVMDVLGSTVYSCVLVSNSTALDLRNLSKGIYIISLSVGMDRYRGRLIIE